LGCSLGGFSTKWLWNGYVTSMMNPSESKCWRSTQIRKIFALCHVYALQPLIDCVLDLLKMLLSLFLPEMLVIGSPPNKRDVPISTHFFCFSAGSSKSKVFTWVLFNGGLVTPILPLAITAQVLMGTTYVSW
jgi:hypothetical protein